jgi:uncharacterized protein YycO
VKATIVSRANARAGDVLLFHRPTSLASFGASPWGTAMTALIHLTTRSRYNHAALMVTDTHLVEATDRGVQIAPLSSKGDEITVLRPDYADEWDETEAIQFAESRVGRRYGYLTAFMCGLNELVRGLHIVIRPDDSMICSELVARALIRAGADFGKSPALVSPGDLATYLGAPR